MSQPSIEAQCPLCDQRANFQSADLGNRKTYTCDTCAQFQISRRAEELIKALSHEDRQWLSKMAASADENSMLLIRIPQLHAKEEPKQPFSATIELRSDLPD